MRLRAISCERYRAFKEKCRIDFSPITLIIGKNGSGKSIISRLPLLIAEAISENAKSPLDLFAGGVDHGTSFQDFVNNRSSLPFSLGVEIGDGTIAHSFEVTLRYVAERRALVIEKFLLFDNGVEAISFEISSPDDLTSPMPKYRTKGLGYIDSVLIVKFKGLFPSGDGISGPLAPYLRERFECFRSALPAPSYLGPFRTEPSRLLRTPAQAINSLGPRGEHALEFLADDRLRQGGEIAKNVGEWFASAMDQTLDVDVTTDYPIASVQNRISGFKASLAETGAGFSQSIPVVVQNYAFQAGRLPSSILIVEQPELHLHPAAHGALADLFKSSAETQFDGRQGAICIIETHSEHFIMRLRRRIAEGLGADHVSLLSLGHLESMDESLVPEPIRVINFDGQGNPDTWPVGVFEEALDDLAAMRKAQRGS